MSTKALYWSLKRLSIRRSRRSLALDIGWLRCLSSTEVRDKPTLAIRREESTVWERRAPINPNHVQGLVKKGVKVLVQPSTRRAYSMPEYEQAGASITDDIESADVIVGGCG